MPLPRFVACLDAVEQILASERTAFVSDMSAVVAGLFAKKGTNPIGKHLDLLDSVMRGGFSGNTAKQS